jgi:hypothetical protein
MALTLPLASVEERSGLAKRRDLGLKPRRRGKIRMRGLRTAHSVGSVRSLGRLSAAVSLALLDGKIGRGGQDTSRWYDGRRRWYYGRRRTTTSAQRGVKEAQIHSRVAAV